GPITRLWPPPSFSRSVNTAPMNDPDRPTSWRMRAIVATDLKSCGANDDPSGPGTMTDPPPRSSAMRIVYALAPNLAVLGTPHRGDVIVRVYATGVSNRSNPSRKNGRFSGKKTANR